MRSWIRQMALTMDRCECAGAVDLPVKRSRWQRHFSLSGSLSVPAQGSTCSQSLDVHSSLAKQHRGGRHEDGGALEKAISCGNRNMMGHFIYPIKIRFTEILLNI